jgi:hypothetical protein
MIGKQARDKENPSKREKLQLFCTGGEKSRRTVSCWTAGGHGAGDSAASATQAGSHPGKSSRIFS